MRGKLVALTIGLLLAVVLGGSAKAGAAGGPILPGPAYGPNGVTVPGSGDRYITLFGQKRTPLVARVQQDGGRVLRSQSFGQFAIPAVTLGGSGGGLSADGSTLVLAPKRSRLGRPKTTLKILDAPRLELRDVIRLDGSFTFDAISPHGSRIYVIEYPSPPDTTRYSVRAVNARTGRLLPDPIVDPNEPPGEMRGYPFDRVSSSDGRWAYTLYDGGGKHPFIHALDTVGGRAVCIDLDAVDVHVGYATRLSPNPDGSELTVSDRKHGPLALVDTATFAVTAPSEPDDGGGFPWLGLVLVPVALVGAWLLARTIRRRRLAPGGAR
jgi:hypothetical protein